MKKISLLCAALLLLSGCTVAPPGAGTAPPTIAPVAPTVRPAQPVATATPAPAETASLPVETALEPAATPTPSVPPPGWDGSLETLTLADFPTELTDAAALVEAPVPLALIAQLPQQDTWLYGYRSPELTQRMILRVGGAWQVFDFEFIMPQMLLPIMAYGDYDGDLTLELGLVVHSAGGTGISIWDLHIIEMGEDDIWTEQHFAPEDYTAILDEMVLYQYSAEIGALLISAGESSLSFDLTAPEFAEAGGYVEPGPFGNIVAFALEGDQITAQFSAQAMFASGVTPKPLAQVSAQVVYTGSAFGLSGLTLSAQS